MVAKVFSGLSERDGWRHVYKFRATVRRCETHSRPAILMLTVFSRLMKQSGWLYYIASPDNADTVLSFPHTTQTARQIGKNHARRANRHEFLQYFPEQSLGNSRIIRHSGAFRNLNSSISPEKTVAATIVDNAEVQANVDKIQKATQEFFKIDIGDGIALDGWMMKPPNFDPSKKYPILFYVYGEPAGQTVVDSWGDTDYLWYLMLTQQGYIVASVDNRGTPAPRGREWRKSIYRKIGVLIHSHDQANAVQSL